MCIEMLVIGPDKRRGPKRCLTNTGVTIRPVPPIGPIVSVMTSHGWQSCFRKAVILVMQQCTGSL